MRTLLAAALCALVAAPAIAQTGTFAGTVVKDSSGTAIGQAQVKLPALKLTLTTNWMGQFRFVGIPFGRYEVSVRAIGFDPFTDSIDVKPGATIDGELILTASPVMLEAQRATAERRLPPGLAEMDARARTHVGGSFVTDSALRKHDDRKLLYMLTGIPGLHQVLGQNGEYGVYLANGRERSNGGPAFSSPGSSPCYVAVYLNGTALFTGLASAGNPPPDFSAFWSRDYSGIEYYSSAGSVPPQYNATGTSCGVLLLWTRR